MSDSDVLAFATARLLMRRICSEDEALYRELYCDAATMCNIGTPLSMEAAARSFRQALAESNLARLDQSPRQALFFAVLDKDTRTAVGVCGMQGYDMRMRGPEVGILLAADVRRRGYAREAFDALVSAAFAAFPIECVWVQYPVEHTVAERLVVSVGFEFCAEAEPEARNRREKQLVRVIKRSSRIRGK